MTASYIKGTPPILHMRISFLTVERTTQCVEIHFYDVFCGSGGAEKTRTMSFRLSGIMGSVGSGAFWSLTVLNVLLQFWPCFFFFKSVSRKSLNFTEVQY